MIKIKEVIVVEGRDDETAIKKAVDAEIIITHGFGIKKSTMDRIRLAKERCGVIILTDPDHAGEQIRKRIDAEIPGCKHAYMPKAEATLNGDIGVENANVKAIIEVLSKVQTEQVVSKDVFDQSDLLKYNLIISEDASGRREALGRILGIGYGNAKTFLRRLNKFGVKREEFEQAVKQIEN